MATYLLTLFKGYRDEFKGHKTCPLFKTKDDMNNFTRNIMNPPLSDAIVSHIHEKCEPDATIWLILPDSLTEDFLEVLTRKFNELRIAVNFAHKKRIYVHDGNFDSDDIYDGENKTVTFYEVTREKEIGQYEESYSDSDTFHFATRKLAEYFVRKDIEKFRKKYPAAKVSTDNYETRMDIPGADWNDLQEVSWSIKRRAVIDDYLSVDELIGNEEEE